MTKTLPELIAELGDEAAAALFRTKLRTVQSWRRRERYPRPGKAKELVDLSDGRLSFAGIFGPEAEAIAISEAADQPQRSLGLVSPPVNPAGDSHLKSP